MTAEQRRWTFRQVAAAAHLLASARTGQRVVYLAGSAAEARAVFDLIALHQVFDPVHGARAHHTNGQERYDHPSGGQILFKVATRSGLRGLTAHRVLVDETRAFIREDLAVMEDAGASIVWVDSL